MQHVLNTGMTADTCFMDRGQQSTFNKKNLCENMLNATCTGVKVAATLAIYTDVNTLPTVEIENIAACG